MASITGSRVTSALFKQPLSAHPAYVDFVDPPEAPPMPAEKPPKDALTDAQIDALYEAYVATLDAMDHDETLIGDGRTLLRAMWERGLDARPLMEPPDEPLAAMLPGFLESYAKAEQMTTSPGMTGYHVLTPVQTEFVANDPVSAAKALAESLRRHAARLDKAPPPEWVTDNSEGRS